MKDNTLAGRYCRALINNPHNVPVKKGDYVILDGNGRCKLIDEKAYTWCLSNLQEARFELMPKGFKPDELQFPEIINTYEIY